MAVKQILENLIPQKNVSVTIALIHAWYMESEASEVQITLSSHNSWTERLKKICHGLLVATQSYNFPFVWREISFSVFSVY